MSIPVRVFAFVNRKNLSPTPRVLEVLKNQGISVQVAQVSAKA